MKLVFFKTNKDLIFVLFKYANFADIFFKNLAAKFLKYIGINNYNINLIRGEQLIYGPIYSLKPVKLEVIKSYIKIYLANNFIKSFKFFVSIFIIFVKKFNGSLQLYINYQSFNNLIIQS